MRRGKKSKRSKMSSINDGSWMMGVGPGGPIGFSGMSKSK